MQNKDACTSIMVGKKASLDGLNYIARNEDRVKAIEAIFSKTGSKRTPRNLRITLQ